MLKVYYLFINNWQRLIPATVSLILLLSIVLPNSDSRKNTAPKMNKVPVESTAPQALSTAEKKELFKKKEVKEEALVTPKFSPTVASSEKAASGVTPKENRKWQSQVNLYLLARVIHAEARGEPFTGKVAVGAVLLNRISHQRFPNSLESIIFKPGEFCTVRDGQIWLTPDAEAIRAARLAVAGWDPSGGALYFYNPAQTTSKWIWSRPVVNKIGRHVFAA